jgi:ribonuclease HI
VIEISVAGATRDENELTVVGGAGVVITFTDEHKRKQKREFYYGLGASSLALTEVQAARLGLASVLPAFRDRPVVLYTTSSELADLITDGAEGNDAFTHQIKELRRWQSYYRNLSVEVLVERSESLVRAKNLAESGMRDQKIYDSETFVERLI